MFAESVICLKFWSNQLLLSQNLLLVLCQVILFWLSWKGLVICILNLNSELEDTSRGIQDRQKIPGSLPSQGFRRNDYSSSPPTRGDSDGSSRGIYGRWDSRSSGRSDRDSDSQSDKDSGKVDILSHIVIVYAKLDCFNYEYIFVVHGCTVDCCETTRQRFTAPPVQFDVNLTVHKKKSCSFAWSKAIIVH